MTSIWKNHIYGKVKTTLNLCDDLYRRAKAQAALEGKPVGRLMEESLEMRLQKVPGRSSLKHWLKTLPQLPKGAVRDLRRVVEAPDFRKIDRGMWK